MALEVDRREQVLITQEYPGLLGGPHQGSKKHPGAWGFGMWHSTEEGFVSEGRRPRVAIHLSQGLSCCHEASVALRKKIS